MSAINTYLPFGLTSDSLLIILVAGLAFMSVLAVWYGLIERDPMVRRVRLLQQRRDELRGQLSASPERRRRNDSLGMMVRLIKAFRLVQSNQSRKVTDKLARAGMRSRDAVVVFLFFKLAGPIALGVVAFVAVYLLNFGALAPGARALALGGSCLLGFFLPEIFVSNLTSKRQLAIQKTLPDALDLLVICAEAGLSLDAGLDRVARELGNSAHELADELALTSVELGFLPDRRMALQNLARRSTLPAIRGVINTLLQTEKYGTPLSQSLRVLSTEFRDQRMLKAEEKAARLPATLTVPMIVFILPTLFIVLIGPAMINVYDTLSK